MCFNVLSNTCIFYKMVWIFFVGFHVGFTDINVKSHQTLAINQRAYLLLLTQFGLIKNGTRRLFCYIMMFIIKPKLVSFQTSSRWVNYESSSQKESVQVQETFIFIFWKSFFTSTLSTYKKIERREHFCMWERMYLCPLFRLNGVFFVNGSCITMLHFACTKCQKRRKSFVDYHFL